MRKIAISAGFDRAPNALAIAELSKVKNEIVGVLVVTPFSWRRLKSYVRQRGLRFVGQAVKRMVGIGTHSGPSMVSEYLRDNGVKHRSLRRWCSENDVPYKVVRSLNSADAIGFLADSKADWLVYAGGGILRRRLISAVDGKVLNAHAGPLPEIRGMNACEWSCLFGERSEISIHVIDRGIDTGGVIQAYPVDYSHCDSIDAMRDQSVLAGIQGMVDVLQQPEICVPERNQPVSRQCFVMAPAIKDLLAQRLGFSEGRKK